MAHIQDKSKFKFVEVPTSMENITPTWCETALRKGGVIKESTKVSSISIERLVNEETGSVDGGGMTLAKMFRINLTYDSETLSYSEEQPPKSCVAKAVMTGDLMMKLNLPYRVFMRVTFGKNIEEQFWRTDIKFNRECIPLIKDVYGHPKVYYTGIIDGGDRGLYNEVVRSTPHKIRTITLMQDMNGWDTQMLGYHHLNFDQAVAVLQNVAVLHGNFWGHKNKEIKDKFGPSQASEIEVRNTVYSKKAKRDREKLISSIQSINKTLKKVMKNWASETVFSLKTGDPMPQWLIPDSSCDIDRVFIFNNSNVREMLDVFATRYPDCNKTVVNAFLTIPSQTLLHGDFHNGNHMYLEEDGKGIKVVAVDFQLVGKGLACSDVVKLLMTARRHSCLSKDLELLKKYHEALILSGVNNYTFEDITKHFIIAVLEYMALKLIRYDQFNPEQYNKFFRIMFGEEKWKDLEKMWANGVDCSIFLFVTSLYLNDTEEFLNGTKFIDMLLT